MFLHNNVLSQKATFHLGEATTNLNATFEQLSSGKRINSAGDDAAGLLISQRLSSQSFGLFQAADNANSGIALTQTVDASLDEVSQHLLRVRQLSIKSQNGIFSDSDVSAIDKEIASALGEVERIAQNTTFAGENLLDGTYRRDFGISANGERHIRVDLMLEGEGLNLKSLGLDNLSMSAEHSGSNIINSDDVTMAAAFNVGEVLLTADDASGERSLSVSSDSGQTFIEKAVELVGSKGVNASLISTTVNNVLGLGSTTANILTGDVSLSQNNTALRIATPSSTLQISANLNSKVGLYDADEQENSQVNTDTLNKVDKALETVSDLRADVGALNNRFSSALKVLSNTNLNIQRSHSHIVDTDFATSTAMATRFDILHKANLAVLSQANKSPNQVLYLLG
ncbi:flagellin [Alteromonas sp. CI.11.F.A3]|uniref:flagellin N-terminal helical domain-containing protein n=1 Tax=Alteromonas sp. CI.11.F.A3 TaxID=3079555 RepID=UPI00294299CD|nr:flagellin [Alteromonas sp. CI.11.F.A3]WOI36410.1 flagellin [Alteromonas sp. CI.11.F.A3]